MFSSALPVRFILNPKSDSSAEFGTRREAILSLEAHESACREVSPLAWEILEEGADAFTSVTDAAARESVELLDKSIGDDQASLTQPSGAAGLTGLIAASLEPGLGRPLNLGAESRVLVIGTEGPP